MSTNVILVCCYSVFLVAVAYAFDSMARRVSLRAQRWRTGAFHYHPDHDAWTCPENQWLWPTSYDPEQRIVRYRAKPVVCNACPVKHNCTTSPHGREVTREIDPWPHSEAGRFHRGIACVVAVIGVLLPLGMFVVGAKLVGPAGAAGDDLAGWGRKRAAGQASLAYAERLPGTHSAAHRLPGHPCRPFRYPLDLVTNQTDNFEGVRMTALIIVIAVFLGVIVSGGIASVRIIREYERGVVFRLGRIRPLRGPGVTRVIPGVERLVRVDLRVVSLTIPPQEVISRDNVPARVNAVVLFRVIDPIRSVMEVENYAVEASQRDHRQHPIWHRPKLTPKRVVTGTRTGWECLVDGTAGPTPVEADSSGHHRLPGVLRPAA
jgi:hypothetical protein